MEIEMKVPCKSGTQPVSTSDNLIITGCKGLRMELYYALMEDPACDLERTGLLMKFPCQGWRPEYDITSDSAPPCALYRTSEKASIRSPKDEYSGGGRGTHVITSGNLKNPGTYVSRKWKLRCEGPRLSLSETGGSSILSSQTLLEILQCTRLERSSHTRAENRACLHQGPFYKSCILLTPMKLPCKDRAPSSSEARGPKHVSSSKTWTNLEVYRFWKEAGTWTPGLGAHWRLRLKHDFITDPPTGPILYRSSEQAPMQEWSSVPQWGSGWRWEFLKRNIWESYVVSGPMTQSQRALYGRAPEPHEAISLWWCSF